LLAAFVVVMIGSSLSAAEPAADADLALVPGDCSCFLSVRAELLRKLGLADADTFPWLEGGDRKLGVSLADVERITLISTSQLASDAVLIVQGARPLPKKSILAARVPDAAEVTIEGKVVHVSAKEDRAVHFVNPRILIAGRKDLVLRLIKQSDNRPPPAPAFANALASAGKHDAVLWARGGVLIDEEVLTRAGIDSATATLDLGEQLKGELLLSCKDASATNRLARLTRDGLTLVRGQLLLATSLSGVSELIPGHGVPEIIGLPRKLLQATEKGLRHATIRQNETTVTVNVSVPVDAKTLRSEIQRFLPTMTAKEDVPAKPAKRFSTEAPQFPQGYPFPGPGLVPSPDPAPMSRMLQTEVIRADTSSGFRSANDLPQGIGVPVAEAPGSTLPPPARQEVKDPYVAELLDVISQTKSVDAFLVTVSLLADARAEPKQVLPVVIRNAERLGIYGRYAFDEEARGAEVARQLTELLGQMSKGKTRPAPTRGQTGPGPYSRLFDLVHDAVGETFDISYANRFDGRIEAVSRPIPGLPQAAGRRHRVCVQIQPVENGSFAVDVQAHSSLDGQPPARNETLEQALRKKLERAAAGDGKN
jgi:hypothetical protein